MFAAFAACFACGWFSVSAQYPQIFFTQRSTQDGMSNNLCEGIIRDQTGYAWIATANGLNRFDGYRFEIFRNVPGDSTSLRNNEVFAVHEDAPGNIWAGQGGVISRLNKDNHSFTHYENIPSDDNSYSGGAAVNFFNDKKGNLWIAAVGGGLNLFLPNENSFSHFYPDNSNRTNIRNSLVDISEDHDGNLWLASFDGLGYFNMRDKQFHFFVYKPEDKVNRSFHNLATAVLCDDSDKNKIWYGTWGSGLHCYNKRSGEIQAYTYNPDGPMNITNIVFDIHQRDERSLWVATEKGLGIFDKQTHSFFFYTHQADNPHSLSGTDARRIFVDKQNALWVATSNGLNIADPAKQNFSVRTLPGAEDVSQIIHDVKQEKIYGVRYYNKRSLLIYDEKTGAQQSFPIPHADEKKSEPFGFFLDSRGLIWLGCVRTGVYLFEPSTSSFTKLETEKQLQIDDTKLNIRAFAEDGDARLSALRDSSFGEPDGQGNIWMASYSHGMIRYDVRSKNFRRFSDDIIGRDHIPFNVCVKIIVSDDDNVWGFFEDKGICVINKKNESIRSFSFSDDKRYQFLETMSDAALDKKNRLWISTRSNGLVLFDWQQKGEKQLTFFNRTTDFPDNNLGSLVSDNEQNLWIAGSDGLIFFDTKTMASKIYTEQDGLYPYNSSITLLNAQNGEIWFPVTGGYCAFEPGKFRTDSNTFRVVLNSFRVFDKEIFTTQNLDALERIELKHEQNFISVEFAALCFTNPGGLKYAYMLDGFDAGWHYSGNRRYASYTDLKPGEYVLKIKAANGDGLWNVNPKTLLIVIHPAWWQTVWLKIFIIALAIILTLLTIRLFTQMKVRKLERALSRQKEVQEIRNRIARDIHDEIGSGLTKISVMSSKLQLQTDTRNENQHLSEKIQKASRDVIESLGEIVWTVNPKNDSLGNLLSYIRQYTGKYFDSTPIRHTVEISWLTEEQKQVEVSPEIKRNLLMIVKEALNNIVKHSGATACEIRIRMDEHFIHVVVSDNGKGFQPNDGEPSGNGLKNMQKRAEEVFGSFTMAAGKNTGSNISVSIPFKGNGSTT